MQIILPNANCKLFLSNTIIACDDWEQACTEFRFQIRNDSGSLFYAWYKVSVVGGATLYEGTTPSMIPGETSAVIDDLVCALPGGLPVGTHTIKVETGPEGQAATDSYSEDIFVIEEPQFPVVYTEEAYNIMATGATLDGYIDETHGLLTGRGFLYGETTSYGTTVWAEDSTEVGYYSKEITGLDPATVYHFKAIATNSYGTAYSEDLYFTTLDAAEEMALVLPNANGKLFLSNTIIACDDWEQACTEFRFQIRNDGDVAMAAWYKVSVVGGATLYDSTTATIDPGATSAVINDIVCALPGGLPVGTHTIKVETGPEGQAATDSYTEPLYVIEETQFPVVYTEDAYNITETSATLDGYIDETHGLLTGRGFEYGKTTSYGTTVWAEDSTEVGYYSKEVTSLDPATVYHYRAIATNSYGTTHGGDIQFTTTELPMSPIVTTEDPYDITPTTAYVHGYLVDSCDVMTHIGFEYGETASYGSILWQGSRTTPGSFGRTLGGLTQNTLYHIRAIAENEYGTGYGEDLTFNTLEANMALVLPNANGKLFLSNTIIACDDWEQACTEFRFQIRNDGDVAMAAWYKVSVVGGATLYDSTTATINPGATSAVIDDLVCALPGGLPVGTHTIKVETGPEGQAATDSYSEDIFVIDEPQPPVVGTAYARDITPTSARLRGYLYSSSGVPTTIGFEYGKTSSYGTTVWAGYGTDYRFFSKSVFGLDQNTTYHVRAIAENEYGTSYGDDVAFTTLEGLFGITFVATAPGISDLHNVDVNDVSDPQNPLYLGKT